jgi:Transposase DDE domain
VPVVDDASAKAADVCKRAGCGSHEALLAELRQRQLTPTGRAKLRQRTAVEHSLAHIGHWQGRRARYLGVRKNLLDLRRVAVVHNLHVLARQPSSLQQAA